MIQIRYNIFETNSSSSDYYNDGPDDDDLDYKLPSSTHAYQTVHIIFKFEDGISEERQSEIIEKIVDELAESFDEILNPILLYFDDPNDINDYDGYDDEIYFEIRVNAGLHLEGKYYPETRYSPAEYPELILDDPNEELPGRDIDFKGKTETKEAILKILKEKGYKEIISIVDIYGDEVDEQDYYDNIKY